MNAALLALVILGQDKVKLGAAPADGETAKVEMTVKTKALEKDQVVFEFEHSCTITLSVKKKDAAFEVTAKFVKFAFTGKGGQKPMTIAWDDTKKLDDVDWSPSPALRDLVQAGFSFALDAAGNATGCTDEHERYMVMLIEPLFTGSAAWLPGEAKAPGDSWEKTVTSEGAEVAYTGTYEKNEEGAAVIATTVAIKDKLNKEAGDGKGRGRTLVDLKTGRPVSSSMSLEMAGTSQVLKFEATSKVLK